MISPISLLKGLSVMALATSSASAFSGKKAQRLQHQREVQSFQSDSETHSFAKRETFYGTATYFDVGMGACGWQNSNSDYVVALNVAQYGNLGAVSGWCGKTIAITYNGNTQYAQIADACPSCSYGGLDMSPSLFASLAPLDKGVFQMSWNFGQPDPKPTTTKPTWTPTPTPRYSSTPQSTPSSTASSSSSTSASSSTTSASSSTSTSTTSTSSSNLNFNNLDELASLFHGLNNLAEAASQ